MIIITFIRRFAGLGCAFALILIVALLAGVFSPKEPYYQNELLYLEDTGSYFDHYDCFDRKVESANDQFGNRFFEAVVYADEGVDRYQLRREYAQLSGTVFLCESFMNPNMEQSRILIYGDGKLLWSSHLIQVGTPNENFTISLAGVEVLEIRRIGCGSKIAIGNFSLLRTQDGQPISSAPGYTRLLDVPCKPNSRWHNTDCVLRDQHGTEYVDTILYRFGDYMDEFYLNAQFSTLSGTVFVDEDRSPYAHCYEDNGVLNIYGDGILLFTSPVMENGIDPVDFTIPVSGVSVLTITFSAGSEFNKLDTGLGNLILR